ncbi:MAG: ParA family protein [Uliginosibacterium sp.]|nr:ParA family protein [Uliginosibacterium sp.]MBK9393338.1 ParA family protein [Uliginosibacterium sp.]
MTVIAVVNRKGGSGKSTLATHIAGYLASLGQDVMLGDVDRLQSSRLWLNLRHPQHARIHGWSIDEDKFARPPAGVKHVVLDTPGGFRGFGLMKISMHADAIVIPAAPGVFDRAAAAESIKELRSLPRVISGKCALACVGMRIDGRTRQAAELESWALAQGVPLLGTVRLAQAYARCLEEGLSIFDFPSAKVGQYLGDWQKLNAWLDTIVSAAPAAPGSPLSRPSAGKASHPASGSTLGG